MFGLSWDRGFSTTRAFDTFQSAWRLRDLSWAGRARLASRSRRICATHSDRRELSARNAASRGFRQWTHKVGVVAAPKVRRHTQSAEDGGGEMAPADLEIGVLAARRAIAA